MFCLKCGAKVSENSNFCTKCGADLREFTKKEQLSVESKTSVVKNLQTTNPIVTRYKVVVVSVGRKKLDFMRFIVDDLGVDLLTAKNMAENLPCTLRTCVTRREAEDNAEILTNLGLRVQVVAVSDLN